MQRDRASRSTAFLLSLLAIIFHLLFLSDRFIGGTGVGENNDTFTPQLSGMHFSAQWPIIQFVFSILIAYAIFSWIVYYFVLLLRKIKIEKVGSIVLTIRIWIVTYLSIVIINSHQFPNSQFSISFFTPWTDWPALSATAYYLALAIMTILFLGFLFICIDKIRKSKILACTLFLFFLMLLGYKIYAFTHTQDSDALRAGYHNQKPNIIILMYCSFKARYIPQFPHFNDYATHSIWFSHVLSPTARSSPSTFAILSGLYPASSHFFENLNWRDSRIDYNRLITHAFTQSGYQTIFMTNISLFRRMDPALNWGFQNINATPTSIYALLLPKLNDFPLTNLLFNLEVTKKIFPYNYNNADDGVHYNPENFLFSFDQILSHQLQRKPVFLMLNDESLHYPYEMQTLAPNNFLERYNALFSVADKQFYGYLSLLSAHHLLDNAIVILTADHGETNEGDPQLPLIIQGIRTNSASNQALLRTKLLGSDIAIGHGGDAMDREQYHVPLIVHFYGNNFNTTSPQKIESLHSTVDIAPTLLSLFNIPMPPMDGTSLVPEMQGHPDMTMKPVFVSTGIIIGLPSTWKAVKQIAYHMKEHYHIEKTGAFGLKLPFAAKATKTFSNGIYWKDFSMVYFPRELLDRSEPTTPILFSVMNDKTFALQLFTESEMQAALGTPNVALLQKLTMTQGDFEYLYQQLMGYRLKVEASINPNVPPRGV